MNFWQAWQALKKGKKVRCKRWLRGWYAIREGKRIRCYKEDSFAVEVMFGIEDKDSQRMIDAQWEVVK